MSMTPRPTSTTPLLGDARRSPSEANRPSPSRLGSSHRRRRGRAPHIQTFPAIVLCTLLILAGLAIWDVSPLGDCYFKPLCKILGDTWDEKDSVWWRNAGAYAPWRANGPGGGRRGLPQGCEVGQVTIVCPSLRDHQADT